MSWTGARLADERAIALLVNSGRGDTAECATAYQVLANVLNEGGDYSGADRANSRALPSALRMNGPTTSGLASGEMSGTS